MVQDLSPPLLAHIEAYLVQKEHCCSGIGAALRWVWTNHPRSLRVKELFETVDTFALLVKQISMLRADARAASTAASSTLSDDGAAGSSPAPPKNKDGAKCCGMEISRIYDLACGHGLLGVLLAQRFKDIEVICVDLVRRDGFDHYKNGFLQTNASGGAAAADGGEGWLQPGGAGVGVEGLEGGGDKLIFIEGDMSEVVIQPDSFVTCIHACNEANKTAVAMATAAGAGFMAMPCCIREGIVSQRFAVRYTRYT